MCDNSIIPISDEQAKLGQVLVGAGRDVVGYIAEVLGDLPKDLVGLIIGDKVKAQRYIQAEKLWNKAQYYLNEQKVIEPEPPSLNIALPLLEAAVNENREELQDLWARLLAASMNPERSNMVRLRFIEAAKKLDPLDVSVILWIRNNDYKKVNAETKTHIARDLNSTLDETSVSVENIEYIGFIRSIDTINYMFTPFGREFLRTVM